MFQCGDDTLGRSGLACAGPASQHHNLGAKGFPDGLQLHLVIRDASFLGQFRSIEPGRKEIAFRLTEQGKQTVGRAHLGKVERRQVDGFILYLQVFRPCHVGQGFADGVLIRFQQTDGGFHQLLLLGIHVSLIGQLVQGIDDAALAATQVVLLISHLPCDSVSCLEADAPDVIRQAVRVLFHFVDALLAVLAVYLGCIGRAYPIALQEKHHVLDVLLLLPALADFLHTLPADARHFIQPFDVGLYHLDGIQPELLHNELGELRPDSFHQTASQIFLNAIDSGRHHFLPSLTDELAAITLVHLPVTFAQQHASGRHLQQVAHQGHKVVITFHLDFHDRISVLRILIGDAFHYTAKFGHRRYFLKNKSFNLAIQSSDSFSSGWQEPILQLLKKFSSCKSTIIGPLTNVSTYGAQSSTMFSSSSGFSKKSMASSPMAIVCIR